MNAKARVGITPRLGRPSARSPPGDKLQEVAEIRPSPMSFMPTGMGLPENQTSTEWTVLFLVVRDDQLSPTGRARNRALRGGVHLESHELRHGLVVHRA